MYFGRIPFTPSAHLLYLEDSAEKLFMSSHLLMKADSLVTRVFRHKTFGGSQTFEFLGPVDEAAG
jgi:hypothetical protein